MDLDYGSHLDLHYSFHLDLDYGSHLDPIINPIWIPFWILSGSRLWIPSVVELSLNMLELIKDLTHSFVDLA
jgi:hypothetical protein